MSFERPLQGGCRCGRNRYVVQFPRDATDVAQVLFNSATDRMFQASPLSAFLRVPLAWYHSATIPLFPDETRSMIRRVYSPHGSHSMRQFCGFCGTPLTYWSEQPRSEADYIQLTLGSLRGEDLADLEDLGLLPDSEDSASGTPRVAVAVDAPASSSSSRNLVPVAFASREGTVGALPWFDTLTAGSRLGNMRHARGAGQSRDGSLRVEWDVMEWSAEDEDEEANSRSGKRKLGERDEGAVGEAMQH